METRIFTVAVTGAGDVQDFTEQLRSEIIESVGGHVDPDVDVYVTPDVRLTPTRI